MKPFPPSSVGADPIATLLRRGWGRSSARTTANAPSSSAPIANECPVRFSGRHGGLPLRLDASLSPLPLFSDEKRRFYTPQLHFRCISNTLQSYEKFLKLTNYKQKILKNFSSARLCCYISNSYGVLL